MMRRPIVLLFTALGCCGGLVRAQSGAPVYDTFQLQCRSNFSGAFNIPNSAFFTTSTPDVADPAPGAWPRIALRVSVIAGSDSQAVWSGMNGAGGLVYSSPNVLDSSLTDCTINNAGVIATEQYFVSPAGVVLIDTANGNSAAVAIPPGGPFGITGFGAPVINDVGEVAFRGRTASGAQGLISWSGGVQALHASEAGFFPAGPYSFIFSPAFNNSRQIAAKVRVGGLGQTGESQPDQIRVFGASGASTLIAEDRDSNPASNFARFDNSVALTDDGRVAFIATLVTPSGARGVYLSDGVTTTPIAVTTGGVATNIEFFGPAVNNRGWVAFRAFDSDNRRAVWAGNGATLRKVVRHLDVLPSDLGPARIDQNDTSPSFGGGVRINRRGDVVFLPALTPPGNNQIEWGTGAYVARARLQGDANLDDAVNFADLNIVLGQFGQTGAPGSLSGDVNRDGAVNFADLNIVLGEFGLTI